MANLANLIVRGLSRLGNVVASKVTADEFVGDLTGNADTATNASKVNNHTVEKDVPANAKFTDTTYTPASASPKMDGTAAVGTSAKYAREDHVHPSDTSRVPTSRKVNGHALSADVTITASDVSAIPTSQKGANSGVAELDANGKVPSSQLPSFVDDVLEYSAKSSFPATGETGKIYIDTGTNLTYRWGGSAYVEISPSLALGTTSSTAYRGDYGNTAYTHATDSSRLTTAKSSAFYKFATTAQGHVASVTAVTKADITGLGIPGSDTNTTYTFENGTNGFKVTPSGGSAQTVTVTPSIANNVTGSGTSGYIAKFNGTNTITSGPQIGSSTTTYLRNDGTWATPPNDNTDTKVTQTIASDNANYRVLFSATADNTTRTEGAKKDGDFYYNPSTGNLNVTQINGVTVGSSPKFTDNNTTYTANNENIGSASAGTAIPADDITAWNAGTMFSASASEGVVTFSAGTAPSLSYTAKSIPNISVTTKSVTTSITAS